MVADAKPAYPPASGVKSFVRWLLFVKTDALIVVDEIQMDKPRALELRFHTQFPCTQGDNGSEHRPGKEAQLRIDLLTPNGAQLSVMLSRLWL